MFTGIVQSQAEVISIIRKNNAMSLKISLQHAYILGLVTGASVAINGVCLTAVEFGQLDDINSFIVFDVIDETLRVSNLQFLQEGQQVNIERSLKVGDEIGGHMLSGHVHTQVQVIERLESVDNCSLTFELPPEFTKYVIAKGFIGINGISLTVGSMVTNSFSVHLIPETLAITNLAKIQIGDTVNLEFDQQTMTIVTTLERMGLS